MNDWKPQDELYDSRVRASFARQTVMTLIGARLERVAPGAIDIALPFRNDLSQQHGFIHAGIVTTIVDSACGYAALSLAAPGTTVLTVEYKVNFMAPAAGELLLARGQVKKPGRTVTVSSGDVFALRNGEEKLIATMLATVMLLPERDDLRESR
jgi:uncharacterized protein (TIGR00369 family)